MNHVKRGTRVLRNPPIKRIKHINWVAILVAILVTGIAWLSWGYLKHKTNAAQTEHKLELKQVELQTKLKELDKNKQDTKSIQQELDRTKAELQAKRARQEADKAYAATIESAPVRHTAPIESCGNPKMCIYAHESGNDPARVNSIGCRGLGQACPGSKLPCGTDYNCQDAYFTNYMKARYGTWENAWAFWSLHRWW